MSATLAIVALIDGLPDGSIFTTRQLIGMGSRGAIDMCLKRLVDAGIIQRLANGVFSTGKTPPQITPLELAQIKAGAFHKEVYEHAHTTATRLAYIPKSKDKSASHHIFATNGTGATSFKSVFGRITLKAVSARKYHEYRNEVWEVLKAVWYLGKDAITMRLREVIEKNWGRKSQESLLMYASSVPYWLFDCFPKDYAGAIKAISLNFNPQARDELDRRYHASDECQRMLRDMPPGFSTFEPPERSPEEYAAWDMEDEAQSSENKCWCPDDPECICPVFTCAYCQTQPLRNRFTLRYG